ncbi:hypothetical protein G6F22_021462 [Rhizopus arrhizus]|nr:hypothetical protein G6F22_021462 [Rhizopus arrhizus]
MASHLASVFDGSLLPSTHPPPPPSSSSLGLPLGLHGSSPSGTSPSGSSGPPGSSNSLFAPLTIHMYIGRDAQADQYRPLPLAVLVLFLVLSMVLRSFSLAACSSLSDLQER